jgi:predicted membrane-bound dolichyl-phosphate-mannose-protein mannosyltransferase
LLAAHCVVHLAALAALLAAIVFERKLLAQAGAAAGLAGALAYAGFFVFVVLKVRNHGIQPPHQPSPA